MSNLSDIFNPVNKAKNDLKDRYCRMEVFDTSELAMLEDLTYYLYVLVRHIQENPEQERSYTDCKKSLDLYEKKPITPEQYRKAVDHISYLLENDLNPHSSIVRQLQEVINQYEKENVSAYVNKVTTWLEKEGLIE